MEPFGDEDRDRDRSRDKDDGTPEDLAQRVTVLALEKATARYVPRFRGGPGLVTSTEQKALGEENARKAAEYRRQQEEARTARYAPHLKKFKELRQHAIDYTNSAHNHDHDGERDVSLDIDHYIVATPDRDVSFGRSSLKPGTILFRIALPLWKGRTGYVIGSFDDGRLTVFHIGPTGGGTWDPL